MKRLNQIAAIMLTLFALIPPAHATPKGGDVDPTFTPSPTLTGSITSVAVQPDGKVLVGGYFDAGNGSARNGIARLNADGSLDSSFQDGMDGVGAGGNYVRSIAVQTNGQVLIGGSFNGVNGTDRHSIARLNADGSLDNGFQSGMAG